MAGKIHRGSLPALSAAAFLVAGAMLATAMFAGLAGETEAMRAFAIGSLLPALTGIALLLMFSGAGGSRAQNELRNLVLFWLGLPALTVLPVLWLVPEIGLVGAYFEMVSGFTTTGATVIEGLDGRPRSLLLWRSLTQWIGGFGTLVAVFAILAPRQLGAFDFREVVVPLQRGDSADGGTRLALAATRVAPPYLVGTGLVFLVLVLAGMSPFDAVNHAMTALSTGGFSTRDGGLAIFGSPGVEAGAALGMLLGAVGTGVFARLWRRKWRSVLADSELHLFAGLLVLASGLSFLRYAYGAWSAGEIGAGRSALTVLWGEGFRVLSVLTTTGFDSAAGMTGSWWSGLNAPTVGLLGLAAIGGAAVSTAGGVRLRSIALLLRHSLEQIRRVGVSQHAPIRNGGPGEQAELRQAWLTAMMYAISASGGMAAISFLGLDFEAAMSATIASLSNVGPLFVLVEDDPRAWAKLSPLMQLVSCMLMMLGRIGLLSVVAALRPD